MLRIAMVQRFLPSRSRGGVGHFTHGLANALSLRGHQVTVFAQDARPEDALYSTVLLPTSRRILGLQSAPLVFPFQMTRQDLSRFDVIHAQGDEQLIRRSTTPVIRTMHGSSFEEALHNGLKARSLKRLLLHLYFYGWEIVADLRADKVVAVSSQTRRYYPRVHDVIGNGVEIARFSNCNESKSDAPSILFVGEVNSRKRGHLLVEAFCNDVRRRCPNAELWLVSPDSVEAEGVKSLGTVDDEQLASLYKRAWVFCLPSSYEGFGRPYVEAMAAGTPVVATPNPGADEVLDRGTFGLIVPDSSLGEGLVGLLVNEQRRREMADKGRERAALYSWECISERYELVYESVLRERVAQTCPA